MTTPAQVLLVDANNNALGLAEKMEAHRGEGKLHRAFSVLIYDQEGRMLLQLRSTKKYHFGGLWSNACCGHPLNDAMLIEEAMQRLEEEFGFSTPLTEKFHFLYEAHDPDSGLTEREFDHVLVGVYNEAPHPNPDEIDDYRWISFDDLLRDVQSSPEKYTPWFRILLEELVHLPTEN